MKHVFLALTIALTAPAGALAAAGPAPVALTDCRFYVYTPDAFYGDRVGSRLSSMWVSFTNTGDAPITAVTFEAVNHGEHLVVTDLGRFTKGVTIAHELQGYSTDSLEAAPGVDTCKVSAARFADGTSATYNTPPQSYSRATSER